MADTFHLTVGTKVEVTSSEHRLRGTLFPARIIGLNAKDSSKLMVEYDFKRDKNTKQPIREEVSVAMVRPPPPKQKNYNFEFGDTVDVFSSGAWWEGVIAEVSQNPIRFNVYSKFSRRAFTFEPSKLRIHQEWVKGVWASSIDDDGEANLQEKPKSVREWIRENITRGTEVEVSNDEEGFEGSWFTATVLEVLQDDKFIVEHQSLRTDDDKEFLKEEVDVNHIRPHPPEIELVDGFNVGDEVDALYNDGWWEGQVIKVRRDSRYRVYFKKTDDECEFPLSKLRPRQEWIDATWVMASQALN